MPLDRRLRDEFERTAGLARATVDADALTVVENRVGHIRRNRRLAASASTLAVVVVALLVAVPHAGGGAGDVVPGSPSSESPAPSRPPLEGTFTSSVHGYTMSYPAGWRVEPARSAAEPDTFSSTTGRTVSVRSEALAAGQTEDEWVAAYLPDAGGTRRRDCFPPRDQWLPVDVGGVPGGQLGGDFGCDLTEAIVFVGQRVYIVDAVPDLPTGLFDQGQLEQMLASVHFLTP